MNWLRSKIAYGLWNFADWLFPYGKHVPDEIEKRTWEIRFTCEATEAEAEAVFERMSDAGCGVEHHALDECPGPSCVGSLERVHTCERCHGNGGAYDNGFDGWAVCDVCEGAGTCQ